MFKRSGVWWTCIRHNGKKIQRSLETMDKNLAKTIEAKIRVQLAEGNFLDKPKGEYKTVSDMIKRFLEEHGSKVSPNMLKSYSASLKHLGPFFFEKSVLSVSSKLICRYKVDRKAYGASPATINRELAMLSKAYSLAVKEWEWLAENPVSKVPKEKENNERGRWLTLEEERRLLLCSPLWLHEIIVFTLNTGMRQDEVLSLEWPRVDLFRKTAMIQKSKNGKPRTIPLNQVAFYLLLQKSKVRSLMSSLVFLSQVGTKINRHNLRRAFNNALKKAEILDFTFHDLRHTFATRLSQRGADLYKISKLLGHKDIRMTQRYAHHSPESLRDGVDLLGKVDYNLTTLGGEEKSGLPITN